MPSPSTGPRTQSGKARSSLNAITHGLTAKTPLLPNEDAAEFRAFVWDVVVELAPQGLVQTQLAHRAAVLMWKQRRVAVAEARVMGELVEGYSARPQAEDEADEELDDEPDDELGENEPTEGSEAEPLPRAVEPEPDPEEISSRLLADEFATAPDELDRLSRYEQRIAHQVASTIGLLLKLQGRKRAAGNVPASQAESGRPLDAEPPIKEGPHPQQPPAQNELPGPEDQSGERASQQRWTGPPGVN